MVLGLPPFAEQQRIVERVEQLMALCTEFERALGKADRSRRALLEATLQQALDSAEASSEIAAGA
jgi:type I restriction enzyme S subunit